MGNDRELSPGEIVDQLRAAHAHHLEAWKDDEGMHYAVLAFTEDDEFTASAVTPGQLAKREAWQRYNLVLSFQPEINRALWMARHRPLPDAGIRSTLWFERATSKHIIVAYCDRVGATGRPVLVPAAYNEVPSGLILPPAA